MIEFVSNNVDNHIDFNKIPAQEKDIHWESFKNYTCYIDWLKGNRYEG